MGRIIVVGYGVDPHFVARAVDKLGSLGHSVEVVTSVDKARELVKASQPAPQGLNPELEALVLQLGIRLKDEFEPVQFGSNDAYSPRDPDAKKVLPGRCRERYGSRRSRAGRAARWG